MQYVLQMFVADFMLNKWEQSTTLQQGRNTLTQVFSVKLPSWYLWYRNNKLKHIITVPLNSLCQICLYTVYLLQSVYLNVGDVLHCWQQCTDHPLVLTVTEPGIASQIQILQYIPVTQQMSVQSI
jgi:hypothetical protein